jgi:hypothetical protein
LVDGESVGEGVLDVLRIDAVPQRRAEHLHPRIVLRNLGASGGVVSRAGGDRSPYGDPFAGVASAVPGVRGPGSVA